MTVVIGKFGRRRERAALPVSNEALCALIEALVAAAFAVPVGEMRARGRRAAPVAFARQCAIYLAHVSLGLGYRRLGRLFRRDRTTAGHACALIEARRDNRVLDVRLQTLEHAFAALAAAARRCPA
ncbi:MAG: hypothetical protein JOZ70_07170 [Pseudolabrys sp.]|nr:hypothetical protein [Pseudolabrys sp.]